VTKVDRIEIVYEDGYRVSWPLDYAGMKHWERYSQEVTSAINTLIRHSRRGDEGE